MDGGGRGLRREGGDVKKSHVAHEQEVTDFGFSFNLLGGCKGALFVLFFSMFFWNVTAVPGVFFLVACLH